MNIQNFDHIKKIAGGIRNLFKIELENHKSIAHLPYSPETLFKFHKSLTGREVDKLRRSEFFEMLKVTNVDKVNSNHFERLHEKFKLVPEIQTIRVGRISTENKKLKVDRKSSNIAASKRECLTTILDQQLDCSSWTNEKQLRKPWRLQLLSALEKRKFQEIVNETRQTFAQ